MNRSDPVPGPFSSISVFVTVLSLYYVEEAMARNTCEDIWIH